MTKPEKIVAALLIVVNAIIAVLTTTSAVHWSGEQITLIVVAANSASALGLSIYFHVKPGTSKEPVAIGTSLTVTVVSVLYLTNGFHATHFSGTAITAIGGAATALVGFATAVTARANVTAPNTPSLEQ